MVYSVRLTQYFAFTVKQRMQLFQQQFHIM